MQGSREVIASTIFVSNGMNDPINAYMRNCNGGVGFKNPKVIGPGHWRIFVPQDLEPFETSNTERAQKNDGTPRVVSTVAQRSTPTPDTTEIDIHVYDLATATPVTDLLTEVEVTLSRLPI